jgi:isocitrate dehydrogenase (NAD+)
LKRLHFRFACIVRQSVYSSDRDIQTIAEGKTITGDLGGKASTAEYTDAIVSKLR